MPEVTAYDVIKKRQQELVNESADLKTELYGMDERKEAIHRRLAEITIEYDILDKYQDQRQVVTYTKETVTVETSGRRKRSDRVHFEDALKKILLAAGRPMLIAEIISELNRFGWEWSNEHTAYQYIRAAAIVESAGKRGFYQLRRL